MSVLDHGYRERPVSDFLVFQFELDPAQQAEDCVSDESEITGEFRCIAGSEVLFKDSAFPLGRFAFALRSWLDVVNEDPGPFVFREGGPVLPPVIRIFAGSEGWHVATLQREFASPVAFALDEVLKAATRFLNELDEAIAKRV